MVQSDLVTYKGGTIVILFLQATYEHVIFHDSFAKKTTEIIIGLRNNFQWI